MKRVFAIFMVLCLALSLLPTAVFAAKAPVASERVYTEADYSVTNDVWEDILALEESYLSKRLPTTQITQAAMTLVTASENYVEGSLQQNGETFTWRTDEGIACMYSPRLRERARNAKALEGYDISEAPKVLTASYETRGGSPASPDVYVIQPYYGLDVDFTEQYVNEGNAIAKALGGVCTTYRTTYANIDNIANAIESGAVVMFDSHGDTNYYNGRDSVSRADTSYICLQTGTGLTSEDYAEVQGEFSTYCHAYYAGLGNNGMKYYCVDGTAIANHMDRPAPNSMLWLALCLGMATDGMHAPLREKGVEVAYGYSQSVTFDYDYMWEEVFWDEMISGETVSTAVSTMKQEVGLWDCCDYAECDTITEARNEYCAFPIVVSSEDTYPGHGKVDALQTVRSTWELLNTSCAHSNAQYHAAVAATCNQSGRNAYYYCADCSRYFSDAACTKQTSLSALTVAALGHAWDDGKITIAPTCTADGVMTYTCTRCSESKTQELLSAGHSYNNFGICSVCGAAEPVATPFEVGASGEFVIAAYYKGVYYAMPNTFPTSSAKIQSQQIEVTDGYVSAEAAEGNTVTLQYEDGQYTIGSNGKYLKYVGSGTNLRSDTNPYYWTIGEGDEGGWLIKSQTTNRALLFRNTSYEFGGYYIPNIASTGEYEYIQILPIGRVPEQCVHAKLTYSDNYNGTHSISCQTCNYSEIATCVYENGACVCGAKEILEPIYDADLKFSHSLTLENDISINFIGQGSLLSEYDTFYLECKIPVYNGNELAGYNIIYIDPVFNGTNYEFTLTGVTAKMMNNDIEGIFRLSKGGQEYYSKTDVYSIAEYAYGKLDSTKTTDTAELKAVCANLLRYGSMAQIQFAYRTDALVDAAMTDAHKSYLTDLSTVEMNSYMSQLNDLPNFTVPWKSATLELGNKVIMCLIANLSNYAGDPSLLNMHLTYTNSKGENITIALPLEVYNAAEKLYAVSFDGLRATEMRTIVSAAIYLDGERVSKTVEYSIESYGGRNPSDLCRAMLAYGDSASAFFTN